MRISFCVVLLLLFTNTFTSCKKCYLCFNKCCKKKNGNGFICNTDFLNDSIYNGYINTNVDSLICNSSPYPQVDGGFHTEEEKVCSPTEKQDYEHSRFSCWEDKK